jgi:uncharacterized membrane-anchored protein
MRLRPALANIALPLAVTFSIGLSAQEKDRPNIPWEKGPITGKLLSQAEIKLPEGFLFTGASGTKTFLEITHNFPSGSEAGMFLPSPKESKNGGKDADNWFVIFEYHDVGHVKDDEKDKIKADKLLKSLQEGTEQGNEERRKRGWPTLEVVSWTKAPFYDPKTNNLTWGTLLRDSKGQESVNYTTRMLGRTGYMQVDLVTDPQEFPVAVADFEKAMAQFTFTTGSRYAEFKKGDKIAAIGLTALVAGGAGAALVKTGLLGKFWKLLIPIFVGIGAFFKKLWNKITGKQDVA